MLLVLDQKLRCGGQLGLGLSALSVGSCKLTSSVAKGCGSISDLSGSEADFTVALTTLALVEIVMGDLFSVDVVLEASEESLDGIERTAGLYHGFDLHHHVHEVAVVGLVESVLLEQVALEGGAEHDQSQQEQTLSSHFEYINESKQGNKSHLSREIRF
jgi:hypothetical protein